MSSHYPAVSAIISSLSLLSAQFALSTSRLSLVLKQSITFGQILWSGKIMNVFVKVFFTSTELKYSSGVQHIVVRMAPTGLRILSTGPCLKPCGRYLFMVASSGSCEPLWSITTSSHSNQWVWQGKITCKWGQEWWIVDVCWPTSVYILKKHFCFTPRLWYLIGFAFT